MPVRACSPRHRLRAGLACLGVIAPSLVVATSVAATLVAATLVAVGVAHADPASSATELQPGMEESGLRTTPENAPDPVLVEPAQSSALGKVVTPYVVIAGGLRFEDLQLREGQTTQSRYMVTTAVSRLGVRGSVGKYITFASEFEANLGGSLGNGASVWEGQAQMSVRDQWVQYQRAGMGFAFGRVTDLATVDYVSAHVTDLLLTDLYTRDPLLYSGANRGNGVLLRYAPIDGLDLGLGLHSTNPTGITGTLLIGGELAPYSRPFYLAAAQVGRSESTLPDQNLHIYMATPSVTYADDLLEAKAAGQVYALDTRIATDEDERIFGFNLRTSVRLKLMGGALSPFLNLSRNENEVLEPDDDSIKRIETFQSYTASGGIDYAIAGRNGVGLQYAVVYVEEPGAGKVADHYINVGGTYWLEENLSLGARFGWWIRDEENRDETYGNRSLFITGRLML
ncbi:hypothetical protein Hoch_2764 [Haliangium ochraceum DSM 14365]|uniref:Porin domain-containing protein n=1 Tax=Haliangium ochraceum (strain DSM 14365 / JCM 11303 / SMP-2) TaxID=502025 RepID=D0LNB5_HALO1|nr:hypothetical protein Hoch_2764 [Haliangium ochraceum DSM 14365]